MFLFFVSYNGGCDPSMIIGVINQGRDMPEGGSTHVPCDTDITEYADATKAKQRFFDGTYDEIPKCRRDNTMDEARTRVFGVGEKLELKDQEWGITGEDCVIFRRDSKTGKLQTVRTHYLFYYFEIECEVDKFRA